MAANLSIQTINSLGTDIVFAAADVAGNYFVNDGRTFLYIRNGAIANTIVSIATVKPCNQGVSHSVSFTLAANEEKFITYLPKLKFNDVNGRVNFTVTNAASVLVAAVKVVYI